MATRNLTQTFNNFRNIAIHHKGSSVSDHFRSDDTVALVDSHDIEVGYERGGLSSLPPQWVDSVEEVQYDISKIKQRIKDLSVLHDSHLNRPTLDEDIDKEHVIEITTQEITQMFHQCQRLIHGINARSKGAIKSEQIIVKNVVSYLASMVQDLSQNFKKAQSTYLKRLKNREETAQQFLNTGILDTQNSFLDNDQDVDELYDKGFTTAQLHQVEQDSLMIDQREKEIQHIVKSIYDLNEIFKDLSVMIIDQGTILDRIDYNVEQASVQVEKGLEQLKKGEKHQKSSRKMLCILFLAVALIIMLITLVITKAK
eukprot:gene18962-20868_t